MGPEAFGERRTDALDAIERSERTERSVAFAVVDYACCERGSDAWKAVEFLDRRDVDVDRPRQRGRYRLRRRRPWWRQRAA